MVVQRHDRHSPIWHRQLSHEVVAAVLDVVVVTIKRAQPKRGFLTDPSELQSERAGRRYHRLEERRVLGTVLSDVRWIDRLRASISQLVVFAAVTMTSNGEPTSDAVGRNFE